VVFDLEEAYQSHWRSYAAAALAGLPEGAGIPSLIWLATDPAVPPERKDPFVLVMLAQASRTYPEAGEALLDLAVSGELPTSGLSNLAWYLAGKELALRLPLSDRSSSAFNVAATSGTIRSQKYTDDDLRKTSSPRGSSFWKHKTKRAETWSLPEINERLWLIDGLLETGPTPAEERDLRTARRILLARRERTN
jgi:hypothetical protein